MKILNVKDFENGLKLIDVGRFDDQRGYFMETFRKSQLGEIIGKDLIVQGNESFSLPHVMRGLHFQSNPFMGKLVRTISGHMIDICLDIRKGSPTCGKAYLIDMPEPPDKLQWIWVPPGFAHGNMFIAPTRIEYLCTGEYTGKSEFCISPFAHDIEWIVDEDNLMQGKILEEFLNGQPIITDKDRDGMSLKDWAENPAAEEFTYGKC